MPVSDMENVCAVAHARSDQLVPPVGRLPIVVEHDQDVPRRVLRGFVPCSARALARGGDGGGERLFAGLIPCVYAGDDLDIGPVVGSIQPKLLAFLPFDMAAGGV